MYWWEPARTWPPQVDVPVPISHFFMSHRQLPMKLSRRFWCTNSPTWDGCCQRFATPRKPFKGRPILSKPGYHMKIAFIGYGEAARAFTDTLKGKGEAEFTAAYDILQDESIACEARSRGLRFETSVEATISDADWIFAAVSADQSLE